MNRLKNGDIFSGCEIICRCGRGGCGVTYLAKNPLGTHIVIKTVTIAGSPERELNGLRNYMAVSGTHPNLLKIFHIGEFDESFYYTMEAADNISTDGEYIPATLGNYLRRGKIFSLEEAVNITRQLLSGVRVMHDAKLIHRDIKPDNIIFVNGIAKLSDPGLVVEAGDDPTFAGTPGFIPPEMIETPLAPDHTADLYAIGKVFYCMVTGLNARQYPMLPKTMPAHICRQLFPVLCKMCDRNPARRFQDIDDFSAGLPDKVARPGRRELLCREFNNWKIMNPVLYRSLLISVAITLLTAAAGGYKLFHDRQKRLETRKLQQLQVQKFLDINKERKELIALQIENALPDRLADYTKLDKALQNAVKSEDFPAASRLASQLETFLRSFARQLCPEIPENPGIFDAAFAASGAAHSFLATPLAEYISKDLRQYRQQLIKYDRKLFVNWRGPRSGENWDNFQYHYLNSIHVPAGAVRMKHSGKLVKIPYQFWVAKNETPHKQYSFFLNVTPQKSPHSDTPAERISWNDILFYCFKITSIMKNAGLLPPGYIVRPPNEAEWEYVAKNAWMGKDTTPFEQRVVFRENSMNRSWPSGSKSPNKLGVSDIYGNVSELMLPLGKPEAPHTIILRGGSFRSQKEACFRRIRYLAYQNIPFDIGFRPVIAPGDMEYFDRHFFNGAPYQAEFRDKVYELVGGMYAVFDWQEAEKMSKLLGGRLAEIPDQQVLDFVAKKLPLAVSSWGCFVGGKKINGKWRWLNSGKEVDFGKWIKSGAGDNGDFLTLRSGKWKAEKKYHSGIFLCEWDKKDYPDRNTRLNSGKKVPLEILRFSVGDRAFMLIDSSIQFYGAKRVCELLGGRLAVLDSPEMQDAVIKKLERFKEHTILLGGYAKRDQWFWISGKKIDFPLAELGNNAIPTVNNNFVVLRQGKFYNSQYSRLFLCEWRKSSASLH